MTSFMTLTHSSTRSISTLTNDDSKILGNIKPKLKKLQEQYNLQTNKYKTLNSSWTPLKDKTANRNVLIFEFYLKKFFKSFKLKVERKKTFPFVFKKFSCFLTGVERNSEIR